MYNKIDTLCKGMEMATDIHIDKNVGIYFIVNTMTEEVYVGQSVNKKRRYKEHLRASTHYTGEPYSKIYHSVKKYGVENFKYHKGIYVPKESLNEMEIYFIEKFDSYKNGLNMTEGGHTGGHNSLLTEEQVIEIKRKLSLNANSQRDIAKDFNISYDIISNINRGETHGHIGDIEYQYPIVKNRYEHVYNTCIDCGKSIGPKASKCNSCVRKGERGTNTKLTENEVNQIIDKLIENNKSIVGISKEFNISASTISYINNGYTWKYLTEGREIPLRQEKETKCIKCGISITRGTEKCRSCHREGDSNPMSKLMEEEVLEIIDLIVNTNISYGDIGDRFGVASSNISKINNGTRWKHLTNQYEIPLRKIDYTNRCIECKIEIDLGNKLCDKCTKQRKENLKVRLLEDKEVLEIMKELMRGNLNNREIGDIFNVDSSTISRINTGNTRKGVTEPYAYAGYPLREHKYTLGGRIESEIEGGLSRLDILLKYGNYYGEDLVCKVYEFITNTKFL